MNELLGCLIHLTPRDKEQILQLSAEMQFSSGDRLVEEGAPISDLVVVLEGQVSVRVRDPGTIVTRDVGVLGRGALLGEMSFVTDEPASATVVGRESGRILRIPYSVLDGLTQQDGGFGTRLYQSLSSLLADRLRRVNARGGTLPR